MSCYVGASVSWYVGQIESVSWYVGEAAWQRTLVGESVYRGVGDLLCRYVGVMVYR